MSNIDKQALTTESARESGNILLIVAARMARRELFTPLHYVSGLPQKVVGMRIFREALEQCEETLQREVCKIVDGHNRMAKKLKEAEAKLAAAERSIAEQIAIVATAEKLVRCKGRYHSELNYRALAKLFGVITPDLPPLEHENVHYADAAEVEITALRQRIAELEAREVTLPPLAPENLASVLDGYEKWLIATTFRDTWNACLSEVVRMNAADIKVKGE